MKSNPFEKEVCLVVLSVHLWCTSNLKTNNTCWKYNVNEIKGDKSALKVRHISLCFLSTLSKSTLYNNDKLKVLPLKYILNH